MSTWFVESPPGKYDERGRHPLDELLEEQFEILFGDEPPNRPGPNPIKAAWEYAKQYFEGIVAPEGVPTSLLERAINDYEFFGLGQPVFFRQRGRVLARIEGAPIDVNPDAGTVIYNPGQTIASIQTRRIKNGEYIPRLAPWVLPKYRDMNEANKAKNPPPPPS